VALINHNDIKVILIKLFVWLWSSRRKIIFNQLLIKAHKAGKPLDDIIKNMNDVIEDYQMKSRPQFAAKVGMVDEIVDMPKLRDYITAFADAVYQDPASVCPIHQMITPRTIREFETFQK